MTTAGQLRVLRTQWRIWKNGTHPTLPDAYCLRCAGRCGLPECEGCAATAYRADRCAEIVARANALKAAA